MVCKKVENIFGRWIFKQVLVSKVFYQNCAKAVVLGILREYPVGGDYSAPTTPHLIAPSLRLYREN